MRMSILPVATLATLAACSPERGPGFGTVGEIHRVEALPVYRFLMNGDPGPADAIAASESRLRTAEFNLQVTVDGEVYLMRQMGLNDKNFVVVESVTPAESLPAVIGERSGCLVDALPLLSKDAAVYTLDCS